MSSKTIKDLGILWSRLTEQGVYPTTMWAVDHVVRIVTGAPIRSVSQIRPQLHVGGQYRQRGWRRLAARGVTAVVNLRIEFDDGARGIAPAHYLYLPTIDDTPPSLEHLHQGTDFIRRHIERGGGVYVHCGSGVGRAPTMAAAYLVSTGMTPAQAWARIRRVRPFIRPRPKQVSQVTRFWEGRAESAEPAPGPSSVKSESGHGSN